MAVNTRTKVLAAFAGGLLIGFFFLLSERGERRERVAIGIDPSLAPSSLLDVARQVQQGGLILHFRHGNRQKWDSVIAFDVHELATGLDGSAASYRDSICLSPQGAEEAKMIGEVFRLGRIPVGAVVASPSCRARQTAMLAFGRIDSISNGLAHTPVTNVRNAAAFKEELRRVFTTVPIEPGKNAIVSGHGNTLENYPGLFASGSEFLNPHLLLETGCYVIRRDPDGTLHLLQRFGDLGVLAANTIDLDPTKPALSPSPGSVVGDQPATGLGGSP